MGTRTTGLAKDANDLPRWQYWAAIGIPAIPFLVVFLRWGSLPNVKTAPSFSDSVEMVNAFLSSAAFAAVVLTLLLQRKDLKNQAGQFQESMEMQALATYLAVVESRREILAMKPVLEETADIRTLHQALSIHQFSQHLDLVEARLTDSMALEATPDSRQRWQLVRAMIAQIARFDVARRMLSEKDWHDDAIAHLRRWWAEFQAEERFPETLRQLVVKACQTCDADLLAIECLRPEARKVASLAHLEQDLDELRRRLVCGVRTILYTVPTHAPELP